DDHCLWALAIGRKVLVLFGVGQEVALLEAPKAVGEVVGKATHLCVEPFLAARPHAAFLTATVTSPLIVIFMTLQPSSEDDDAHAACDKEEPPYPFVHVGPPRRS